MATNSPRSISRLMSSSTSLREAFEPKPLETALSSRNAIGNLRFESPLHQTHQTVENKPDDADGQDAKNDVLINEGVVFLPKETPDSGCPGKHFRRDNHQPGDAEAEPKTGEHVRQRRGNQHLEERFTA